jgi:uncharacterized protein with PIN domain
VTRLDGAGSPWPGNARLGALDAGVDLLCIGNPDFPDPYEAETVLDEVVDAVVRAVADGVVPVSRLEQAASRAAGASGLEVVLVVEGRSTPSSAKVVEAVLAAAPQTVVVHQDQGPDAARSLRSYGGGAATAHAVAELLGGAA